MQRRPDGASGARKSPPRAAEVGESRRGALVGESHQAEQNQDAGVCWTHRAASRRSIRRRWRTGSSPARVTTNLRERYLTTKRLFERGGEAWIEGDCFLLEPETLLRELLYELWRLFQGWVGGPG